MSGIEILTVVGSVVGTAVSAIGSMQQASAQRSAAAYNRQIAERNAQIQERNALIARQQSVENAERQRRLNRKRIGSLRNRMVSMDLLEDNVMEGELDALSVLYQGELRVQSGTQNAATERLRGSAAAADTGPSPGMAAASTLLQGAGNTAGMAYDYGWFS